MEFSTIIGLILGLIALILGMFLKGAPVESLVQNPAAFVIIFVGTAATLFMGFPLSELKKFPTLIKMTIVKPKMISKSGVDHPVYGMGDHYPPRRLAGAGSEG